MGGLGVGVWVRGVLTNSRGWCTHLFFTFTTQRELYIRTGVSVKFGPAFREET